MARVKRLASSLLLATGIVLVFGGLTAALGFTPGGMIASVAVIAALLYAGAVWFGPAPPALAPAGAETVIVFDRSLHIAAGATPGTPLLSQFPAELRETIEAHCRAALAGEHSHFSAEIAGHYVAFDVAPIQTVAGAVFYGVLITGAGSAVPAVTPRPLTTVA
ncbi:MAG TPA: hypothetical protein VF147_09540 [Vicinamibacterales bacterium]